jgi:restriction endonuclease S subunit
MIADMLIPLPPTEEQRAIATALSDVDALIGTLDRLIAKKRNLKQATMQQLLTGQTRLPGFSGEWEEKTLAHVVDALEAGVSVNSVDEESFRGSDELCVLKTSAVVNGRFIPSECKKIASRDLHRATLSPLGGTIVISRMNTPDLVGECGYVENNYPFLFVPDRLWMTRFRPGSNVNARWLSYVLSSADYKRMIKAAATGTSGSMKNLSKDAFLSLPVRFPVAAEQTAIATILSDMDADITALEARRDKTRALKQGMMQELLTGRIRLL